MLHGKGYDRWFDKSFNMIFTANGRVGLNTEHSWADAPVTGQMWESVLADEALMIGYDENGHSKGTCRFDELPNPIKMRWETNSKVSEILKIPIEIYNFFIIF
jgi:carnitine O-palmitoyltransferase 1